MVASTTKRAFIGKQYVSAQRSRRVKQDLWSKSEMSKCLSAGYVAFLYYTEDEFKAFSLLTIMIKRCSICVFISQLDEIQVLY